MGLGQEPVYCHSAGYCYSVDRMFLELKIRLSRISLVEIFLPVGFDDKRRCGHLV
jgi:hypothetical protein